jgi:hypothetical protein
MSERPVEITQTYVPGSNLGSVRAVTVDGIPAIELSYEGMTEEALTFEVADRVHTLIQRALDSNDEAEQRITYTATDPGVPIDPCPSHERFSTRRSDRHVSASSGGRVR